MRGCAVEVCGWALRCRWLPLAALAALACWSSSLPAASGLLGPAGPATMGTAGPARSQVWNTRQQRGAIWAVSMMAGGGRSEESRGVGFAIKDGIWGAYDGIQSLREKLNGRSASSVVAFPPRAAEGVVADVSPALQGTGATGGETLNALVEGAKGTTDAIQSVAGAVRDGVYDASALPGVLAQKSRLESERRESLKTARRDARLADRARKEERWSSLKSSLWSLYDFSVGTVQVVSSVPENTARLADSASLAAKKAMKLPQEAQEAYSSKKREITNTIDEVTTGIRVSKEKAEKISASLQSTVTAIKEGPRLREEARRKKEEEAKRKQEEDEKRLRVFNVAKKVATVTFGTVSTTARTVAATPKAVSETSERVARFFLEPIYEFEQRQARIEKAKAKMEESQPKKQLQTASAVDVPSEPGVGGVSSVDEAQEKEGNATAGNVSVETGPPASSTSSYLDSI